MDEADVADFWRGAKQAPRRLTRAEKAFIQAAWAGSTENLRILFDYGMPTPRVSQIRTPGGSIERAA